MNDFIPRPRIPEKERFEKFIDKTNSCWNWTGALTHGYGGFRGGDQKRYRAHRVAYKLYVGEIPKGKIIMHMCDNRKCVNPKHLKIGTHRENTIDMHKKGRWPERKGTKHPMAKLKEDDVKKIRTLAKKITHRQISEMYSISKSNVSSIVTKDSWKHI